MKKVPVFIPSHQKHGEYTGCSSFGVESTDLQKIHLFHRSISWTSDIPQKKHNFLSVHAHIFRVVYQITTQLEIFLLERHYQSYYFTKLNFICYNELNDLRYLNNIDFKDQIQNSQQMVCLILGHPVC